MQAFFSPIGYNLHPYDFSYFFYCQMAHSAKDGLDLRSFPHQPVYAVILAGGMARRMQGKDKGLLQVNGRKLIDYSTENISHQVDHIFISANRNLEQYQALGHPVLIDSFGDYAGPLAGILAALEKIHDDALLVVVPCDMPKLPPNLVTQLKQQLYAENADICCIRQQHRLQPLINIMHSRVRESLQSYLQSGKHKVQDWVQAQQLSTVSVKDESLFNINSADDLYRFEQQTGHE